MLRRQILTAVVVLACASSMPATSRADFVVNPDLHQTVTEGNPGFLVFGVGNQDLNDSIVIQAATLSMMNIGPDSTDIIVATFSAGNPPIGAVLGPAGSPTAVRGIGVMYTTDNDGPEIPVNSGDNLVTLTVTAMDLTTLAVFTHSGTTTVTVQDFAPEPSGLVLLCIGVPPLLICARYPRRSMP